MMKKITLLLLTIIGSTSLAFGQTMVNDFELDMTGVEPLFGATAAIVENPSTSGINTTENCLELGNSGVNWFSLVRINVDPDLTISDTETKFLSVLVYKTTTDLACRFNATADDNNGTNPGVISALNSHSEADAWEQIIIPVEFPRDSGTFSLGTLYNLILHPDIKAFNNANEGPLDNGAATIFIDELQILDENPIPPLSTSNFEINDSVSLYPNPAKNTFKVSAVNGVSVESVSVYNILGKQVNVLQIGANQFDISSLSTGMYMVKIKDSKGSLASKKLFVR